MCRHETENMNICAALSLNAVFIIITTKQTSSKNVEQLLELQIGQEAVNQTLTSLYSQCSADSTESADNTSRCLLRLFTCSSSCQKHKTQKTNDGVPSKS